jgi:nitroreductase
MSDRPEPAFVALDFERIEPAEMLARARAFRAEVSKRRSVRAFSPDEIPAGLLDECIAAAGCAPSGAHQQPWSFVVVRDAELKRAIRSAAEEEERKLYAERISDEWREALWPLGTDADKPFLEIAPALIVVFLQTYGLDGETKRRHYYAQESVGIACGVLLCALHHAGLATLTHTPSPMGFLARILERPKNEKAYLLVPVGFPTPDCHVPDLTRKPLDEIRVES